MLIVKDGNVGNNVMFSKYKSVLNRAKSMDKLHRILES